MNITSLLNEINMCKFCTSNVSSDKGNMIIFHTCTEVETQQGCTSNSTVLPSVVFGVPTHNQHSCKISFFGRQTWGEMGAGCFRWEGEVLGGEGKLRLV